MILFMFLFFLVTYFKNSNHFYFCAILLQMFLFHSKEYIKLKNKAILYSNGVHCMYCRTSSPEQQFLNECRILLYSFTKKYVLWGRERENIDSKHICTCISGCLHSNIRNYKIVYLLRKDLIKLFPNVQVFISEFCNSLLVQGSQFFEKDFF